jgi:anti-sigma B factor antagonist
MSLLTHHMHGACHVFKLCFAKFDAALVPEFKRCLAELATPMPGNQALDMSDVRFVDSSALGVLVSVYKASGGGRVRLVGVTPPVLGLLKLTRMDRVFEIVDTLEPATA